MKRLPLTVIGGYLGAGKTTLINHILTSDHGRRVMVMVNDFGAVNIDASLLASATQDRLELTNGCVCCTMGADLFMAIGDVLDRPNWPDHVLIEASGVADPAKIAQVAQTEPELSYAGIVTVVDGLNYAETLQDAAIAPQLRIQVDQADVIYVSKQKPSAELSNILQGKLTLGTPQAVEGLLWDLSPDLPSPSDGHAHFKRWAGEAHVPMTRAALLTKLDRRPAGLYRFKGFVPSPDGLWLVQVVGRTVEVTAYGEAARPHVVGIGLQTAVRSEDIETWWCS